MRVAAGTRLRFRGPFGAHLLTPGRIVDGIPIPDPRNPIRVTQEGEEASFVAIVRGAYGYFCYNHAVDGMMGAIFVE